MENFDESFKARVRSALDPSLQTLCQETSEDILSSLVRGIFCYIAGSALMWI